jgi:hypothetical protein
MMPLKETRKFTINFFGTIIVLVWLIALVLGGAFVLPELVPAFRALGTATLATYVVAVLLDRWLWRITPFKQILGIPDLSGRWEGWYWNTVGRQWLPNAHEVNQRSFHLTVHSWGPTNESKSILATIFADEAGMSIELVSVYGTVRISGPAVPHRGTSQLSVSESGKYMEGMYWTDRTRTDGSSGQSGFIRLARVDGQLKQGLKFLEQGWGMPKPTDSPS